MRLESDQIKTLAALALLLIGFIAGLWLPTRLERAALQGRIDDHRRQLDDDLFGADSVPELRRHVADLQDLIARSDRQVPPTHDLGPLLGTISARFADHALLDPEILTDTIVRGRDYDVIPLSLRFGGTYDHVYAFLRDVEAMKRLVRVYQLQVTGNPTRPDDPVIVRMRLATFSAAEGESR